MRERLRDPAVVVLLALGIAIAVGSWWGLPGSDSWIADAVSPRSCGLGAIVETYWPGHFHKYPPLHTALLTVLSLPWIGLAASRAGTGIDTLGAELVKPLYMTGIEVSARLVAAAMAVATVGGTMALWGRLAGRRAGIAAGVIVASNAVFVLYAHTGNTDVPYLFWLAWALVEIDRVACGEPRETHALLLATAAVLTKDQAAAALILPLPAYLVLVPWFARRAPVLRRGLLRAVLLSVATYAVVSGAVVNPVGFRRRIAHLVGPASQQWVEYPGGVAGALAMTRDSLHQVTDFTSWPIVLAAFAGLVLAFARGPGLARARALLPLTAAASFACFFSLPVRQSEHRYFLPETLFFLPYAGLAYDAAWARWSRARALVAGAAVASLLPALLGVASMDATLLADPRYVAERFLARLSPGTHVEIYGGPIFMPRIPAQLVAVRPGVEPIGDRQAIPDVTDLVDPEMDPRSRAPDAIVLATELSNESNAEVSRWVVPPETMQYRDPRSHAFLRKLFDGSLGYARVLRATCTLPWPLECRRIHHSTGGEVWVYMPLPASVSARRSAP
jgi:4-amino-4-deoxy-L-arabinose transferase-like glycosyltransferase